MTRAWPCEYAAYGSKSHIGSEKKTAVGRDTYIERNRERESGGEKDRETELPRWLAMQFSII